MTRTIRVETELPTSADKVWDAMKHPVSFLYVTRGLVGFPALAGRTDPVRPGEVGTGWVLAFNVIPAYRHTIEVLDVDEATRSIRTHEYGGILRRWDHSLHAETISETRCRYSDTVVIDAGPLTRLVALVAIGIYRYRQRRWHRLVGKQLLPTGPCYSHPAPPTIRDVTCLDGCGVGVGGGLEGEQLGVDAAGCQERQDRIPHARHPQR